MPPPVSAAGAASAGGVVVVRVLSALDGAEVVDVRYKLPHDRLFGSLRRGRRPLAVLRQDGAGHHVLHRDYLLVEHDLFVVLPRVIAVAHPRAVKFGAAAAGLGARVADGVMLRVAVLAAAPQDPGALSHDVEEAGAGALGVDALVLLSLLVQGVLSEAVSTEAPGLFPDRDAVRLALLALPCKCLHKARRGGC